MRDSYDRDDKQSTIHMVNIHASAKQLLYGQLKTDNKSNKINTIQVLIQTLDLHDSIATIAAITCQTQIAKAITRKVADDLLAVRGKQSK